MERILRVNMTTQAATIEPLPEKYRLLGGRGLTAAILLDEVEPQCEPLGQYNKLVFAIGLLAGTEASSTNRLSVGAKSPLTGGIKESNGGGVTALRLAQQNFRAVIIEGQPPAGRLFCLVIKEDGADLVEAGELAGCLTGETAARLLKQYGRKSALAVIGPAGEQRYAAAGIANTDKDGYPGRFCARGGMGAVMGSKGLKAVIVLPAKKGKRQPKNKKLWQDSVKEFHRVIRSLPVTAQYFPNYGTPATLEYVNEVGALPTRNFRSGRFERAEEVSGARMRQVILERGGEGNTTHACMPGCLVRSSNCFAGTDGKLVVSPMEYENNAMLGPNLGIGDFDTIAELNRLCNEAGVDAIEMGVALGVAAEAGLLSFGDGQGALNLLSQVLQGSVTGRVLGQGAVTTGKVLGVDRVPAVMGQAIPAYDPRGMKANGVTYTTCAMGADHTCGNSVVLKDIDQTNPHGKVDLSRTLQLDSAIIDTMGLCIFLRQVYIEARQALLGMINAIHGTDLDWQGLTDIGQQVLAMEREFNRQAGFAAPYNLLPEFMRREPLEPYGAVWDITDEELAGCFQLEFGL